MVYAIEGNTALVSASSSGLGKAAAKCIAEAGANIVINGRDEERLAAAVEELEVTAQGDVLGVPADITDPGAINNLVERTVEEFGGVDHLVTNAGGPPSGEFEEIPEAAWYDAFDLLVMSVVRLVREAAPHLEDGGGTIVMITSWSVKEAIPALVLSNSVRMSLIGLARTLSKELAPAVRTNTVLPSSHETERQRELIGAAVDRGEYESYEAGLAAKGRDNPMDRIGRPEELGDVVTYLSSERSSFINGVALSVDGGQSASNL